MAYSTYADLKKAIPEETLIQLTDDEGAGTVNQARISEAIAQADANIDGYLGARYAVPLAAPVPAVVRMLSVDLAVYNLYSRRLETIPETRADRHKNALRMLEGIAKGLISLGATPAPEAVPDAGGPEATRSPSDRTFTKTTLEGY